MTSPSYDSLIKYIETLPVVSSHEHHLPDSFHADLTLDRVFKNSYLTMLASLGTAEAIPGPDYLRHIHQSIRSYQFPGDDSAKRAAFIENCHANGYYVWLEKGIRRIYELDCRITASTWDEVSTLISKRHSDSDAHLDILRQVGGYKRAVQDAYWCYGSDNGHPELFSPTMRTDMFVRSFHPSVKDHNGNTPFDYYPDAPRRNFSDYLGFVEDIFTRSRENGAVALKSASAYDRTLLYGEGDLRIAADVFFESPDKVSGPDRQAYEDYMFNWFCRLAARIDVPLQVHTGLGKLAGSRPLLLESAILRHPQVRFVLFHAGYPWYDDVAGLAHNHSNISIDMVWAPIVSTTGAVLALHEFLEVAHSCNRIAWGSDAWTSEEAIGALLAWRHVVARVLAEKVDDDYLDMGQAEGLAERLMYRNAMELYEFEAGLSP